MGNPGTCALFIIIFVGDHHSCEHDIEARLRYGQGKWKKSALQLRATPLSLLATTAIPPMFLKVGAYPVGMGTFKGGKDRSVNAES
jgi:hypothetical protein